jgi:hypothetical protein
MAEKRYDFSIKKGSDWTWSYTFPTAVSLLDATVNMDIRATATSPTAILQLKTSPTGNYLTLTGQQISCLVPSAITSAVTESTGVFDLEVTFPTNSVQSFLFGNVVFTPEVTQQ